MASRTGSELTPLSARPNYNSGRPTTVFANHFKVNKFPNCTLYQYEVTIGKGAIKPHLSRKLWDTSYVQDALGGNNVIFDGRHIAWCNKKLPFGEETVIYTTLNGSDPKISTERDRMPVKIAYSTSVNLEFIHKLLLKHYGKDANVIQGLNALNNLMRQTPSRRSITLGNSKNFYSKQDSQQLSGALEAWRGIFQSLRPSQGFLTVNIDLTTTVVWTGGISLLSLICKHRGRQEPRHLASMDDKERHKLQQAIKGLTFFVTHRGEQGRRKVYTIKRLMKTNSVTTTFDFERDGMTQMISIQSYMKMAYNQDIRYPELFCVQSTKGDILPLEFCTVHAGQRYTGVLSPDITSSLIKIAAMRPGERKSQIARSVEILQWSGDPMLHSYGLQIDRQMLPIQARLLPQPKILFGSNRIVEVKENARWDLRNVQFFKPMTIRNWAVIDVEDHRQVSRASIDNFIRTLFIAARNVGMTFSVSSPVIETLNPYSDVAINLQNICRKATERSPKKDPVDLLLCVYSNRNTELYNKIKAACDIDLGVACQVALRGNIDRASPQFACNLLLKINKKLGGVNSRLHASSSALSNLDPTIVLGADVTHSAPGSLQPSLASLVSSMDLEASNYCAQGRAQDNRVEMIADLEPMVRQSLITFHERCRQIPKNIIYFRDGVSESQFPQLKTEELGAIRNACISLDNNYRPKIMVCVVTKRHHTRFFPDAGNGDKNGNVKPGLLVDSVITDPVEYDFFIQAHHAIQGTARPAHYHVIDNKTDLTVEAFQELCHNMCFNFERSTTAVSIVPAIYYAHIVSQRLRAHLTRDFDTETEMSDIDSRPVDPLRKLNQRLAQVAWYM